jgi:carbamoyltransferase
VSKSHTYILGINAYDHDVSACLLRDGEIAFAISKERITRHKHATGFYQEVVDYCLKAEGITLDDVDLVVRNCYVLPVSELERRLVYQDVPEVFPLKERQQAAQNPIFRSRSNKVAEISHHVAHAYSAFAVCPFEEGAVMVVDGVGSYASDVHEEGHRIDNRHALARESESYYRFQGSTLEPIKKVWLEPTNGFLADEFFNMNGLGALYSRVSSYIFADWNKCGEVMGLAPYGRPHQFRPLIESNNGELSFPEWTAEDFNDPYLPEALVKWEDCSGMQHWKDLAWRMQEDTERLLIERAIWLRETTGAKNLCISGGVALNCVANGRIVREAGYDNVWIQPAAGDDGIAIGCAYYGHLAIQKKPRSFVMQHAYTGAPYSDAQAEAAAKTWLVDKKRFNGSDQSICRETAKVLAGEKVVGWFQGGSEFGPRALGNRSIIADPRNPKMKDVLNARVKHRQAFRPFAPIVLAERSSEIFEGQEDSPFMLLAKNVLPEWRDRVPAIVHVDGTARVQTVRREHNERLYVLLKEFEALTGVPVLLNTSFNIRGEPIVETPVDAVKCFMSTGIDYLAMHDMLITKNRYYRAFYPIMQWGQDVATMVKVGTGADLKSKGED